MTRLSYFRKVLVTKLDYKTSSNIGHIFVLFWKTSLLSKTAVTTFLTTFGAIGLFFILPSGHTVCVLWTYLFWNRILSRRSCFGPPTDQSGSGFVQTRHSGTQRTFERVLRRWRRCWRCCCSCRWRWRRRLCRRRLHFKEGSVVTEIVAFRSRP